MLEQPSQLDSAGFAVALTEWYRTAQRDLPWRRASHLLDAYEVLVSEVMLQQTTVATVSSKYCEFLSRFPTIGALAAAPLEDVLALWSGLGYYQRARNLHACAIAIVRDHGGQFPNNLDAVMALPGIGRYTAGAVTSLAFEAPSPIVDANVARVLARVLCLDGDLKSKINQDALWRSAGELAGIAAATMSPVCRPSNLNSGLMELGALICTPRDPQCGGCPVQGYCRAFSNGRQNSLPQPAAKARIVELRDACAFVAGECPDGSVGVLVRQRPHEGKIWWRGMWELPRITRERGETSSAALRRLMRDEHGVEARTGVLLHTLQHTVTHHRITLDCYAVEIDGTPRGAQWLGWEAAGELAMPTSMRRLTTWLQRHGRIGQLELL